jgi:hypothetical protein
MPDIALREPPAAKPASEELRTAFPLPRDVRFDGHLVALDHGFVQPRVERRAHRARPFRVVLLAALAVIFVLVLATAAAATAWELAGERYVDEVVRDNL